MNLTSKDLAITMAMSIAVIFMSFTFPALGMTGHAQNESDIPEFNITKGQVEFAREQPELPSRPSEGRLVYVNNSESWQDNRQVYLQQGGSDEYLLSFFDDDPSSDEQYHANLIKFNASGSFTEDVNINESEAKTLESVDGAYEVGLDNMTVLNDTAPYDSASLDWKVISQPSDQQWYSRIPGLSSIIGAGQQLAGIVGWIGSMIWYAITFGLVTLGNAVLMFFNTVVYFIDFMWWLTSTYGTIVSGAPTAWAGVIVAIPGIILGFQFTKLIAVGIKLLPLT